MFRKRRFILSVLALVLGIVASLASWIHWSHWPDPQPMPVFADADALVILGGGDLPRWQQGVDLAKEHPEMPVIVTGDDNYIVEDLTKRGIPRERILHEQAASSTVENAKFTKPLLDKLGAKRVILVTNWFHVPRAVAIFRKYQPGREFTVSFSSKPEPMTQWDRESQRRERMAALHNLIVHGVWSFGTPNMER